LRVNGKASVDSVSVNLGALIRWTAVLDHNLQSFHVRWRFTYRATSCIVIASCS